MNRLETSELASRALTVHKLEFLSDYFPGKKESFYDFFKLLASRINAPSLDKITPNEFDLLYTMLLADFRFGMCGLLYDDEEEERQQKIFNSIQSFELLDEELLKVEKVVFSEHFVDELRELRHRVATYLSKNSQSSEVSVFD